MASKTLTISMSDEDYNYLKDDDLLSPSKIFQVALHNIKENRQNWDERVKILQNKIIVMQKTIFELNEKIEELELQGGKK